MPRRLRSSGSALLHQKAGRLTARQRKKGEKNQTQEGVRVQKTVKNQQCSDPWVNIRPASEKKGKGKGKKPNG